MLASPCNRLRLGAVALLVTGALALAGCVASDDAPVLTVEVESVDMAYVPDQIEVPVGTRLVIELENTDAFETHDLQLDNGERSQRLPPGGSATIDVGVIESDVDGWCTVSDHHQRGMQLDIVAIEGD